MRERRRYLSRRVSAQREGHGGFQREKAPAGPGGRASNRVTEAEKAEFSVSLCGVATMHGGSAFLTVRFVKEPLQDGRPLYNRHTLALALPPPDRSMWQTYKPTFEEPFWSVSRCFEGIRGVCEACVCVVGRGFDQVEKTTTCSFLSSYYGGHGPRSFVPLRGI